MLLSTYLYEWVCPCSFVLKDIINPKQELLFKIYGNIFKKAFLFAFFSSQQNPVQKKLPYYHPKKYTNVLGKEKASTTLQRNHENKHPSGTNTSDKF